MRTIAAQYGIRHFELVHDMFTVDQKRVVAFCEAIRTSGEAFTWDCSARTDCVDEALLQEMAASGCRGLFFGIESGSKRMQRIIDKDLDPAKAEEMLRVSERLGIRTTASLIVGFPEEEWADVEDTLTIYMQSARCSQSHPQINLLAPLAGTPLATNHAETLVLDEYCSDMSHQGLSQAAEDLELIRTHPEIFPNFYMVPTPMLDRTTLFELREFLGMAVDHFRWLLCAIAQRTNLLQFHRDWRTWRQSLRGNQTPGELRRYYAEATSRRDFLRFVHEYDSLRCDPIVATLLRVEETLSSANTQAAEQQARTITGDVRLAGEVRVVALDHDLTHLTESIAAGAIAPAETSFYATREDENGVIRLNQITPFLANVLNLYRDARPMSIASLIRREFGFEETQDISGVLLQLTDSLRSERWVR